MGFTKDGVGNNSGGFLSGDSGDGTDDDAIHDNVAGEISAVTSKAAPTEADFLLIEDAAASNAKKKITLGDLPARVADFIELELTADEVISVGNPIVWDTTIGSQGDLTHAAGKISGFKDGRKYLVNAQLDCVHTGAAAITANWYDVTAAGFVGSREAVSYTVSHTNHNSIAILHLIYAPTADSECEFRWTAGTSSALTAAVGTHLVITEIR